MFVAGAFAGSGYGSEENLLTKFTHLVQNLFELTVVSNCLLVKLCLLFGESHRDGLIFDLISPTPGIGQLAHQAALGDPTQSK